MPSSERGSQVASLPTPRRASEELPAAAGSGTFAGPVVRLHIGLEDVDDLTADIDQALAVMRGFGK